MVQVTTKTLMLISSLLLLFLPTPVNLPSSQPICSSLWHMCIEKIIITCWFIFHHECPGKLFKPSLWWSILMPPDASQLLQEKQRKTALKCFNCCGNLGWGLTKPTFHCAPHWYFWSQNPAMGSISMWNPSLKKGGPKYDTLPAEAIRHRFPKQQPNNTEAPHVTISTTKCSTTVPGKRDTLLNAVIWTLQVRGMYVGPSVSPSPTRNGDVQKAKR